MMESVTLRTGGIRTVCLILMLVGGTPPVAAEPQAIHINTGSQLDAAPWRAAAQLEQLARAGRFDDVLSRLKNNEFATLEDAGVQSLIDELERYSTRDADRRQQRLDAYNEALGLVGKELEAGDLTEALIASIDAHSLAPDPDALLKDATIVKLIVRAEEHAQAAEAVADWVEALTTYRALDLLFDDKSTYREHTKQVSRHVRVLRLYAPEKLQQLYDSQAERRRQEEGESQPPVTFEPESWETQLAGIKESMLRQTLASAANHHVGGNGYAQLMSGAVDGLLVMLNTQGLANTFEGFGRPEELQKFRTELAQIGADLEAPGKVLNFVKTHRLLARIRALNEDTINLPLQVLIFELTEGVTDTLDEFTTVIWPEEWEQFKRSTHGTFTGVGIQITRKFNYKLGHYELVVVTPLANTPARQAGILAGDIITEVDGISTTGWLLDRAVRKITGAEGTNVRLMILRGGEAERITYQIRRTEIPIESVRGWSLEADGTWNYWIDWRTRIGYVRLTQFIPQSAADLDAAYALMEKNGPLNGLILDLRFNPGGLLNSSTDIADRFIAQGRIVSTVAADGTRKTEVRAKRHPTYRDLPVAVLINQGSASASEIVSGAMQDYRKAIIVGARSFGKGSVQDLYRLDQDKAVLKLTTQYYELPRGRTIHRKPNATNWGINPDLVIKMTDVQVKEALEFRQELDVLRDDQQPPAPPARATTGAGDPVDPANGPDEAMPVPEPKRAEDILENGVDPQLEAALLVLKTRLVAQRIRMARK